MPNAAITPDRISIFLLDRGPDDNFLLGEQEMTPDLMEAAMETAVDAYNTISPITLDPQTVASFPYRYELLIGTCSYLLKSKAINMIRNLVNYTTGGGVTVDEKKSAEDYVALSKDLMAEFMQRCQVIKVNLNQANGYGRLGSQFATTGYSW
jgi:hypothetical protein